LSEQVRDIDSAVTGRQQGDTVGGKSELGREISTEFPLSDGFCQEIEVGPSWHVLDGSIRWSGQWITLEPNIESTLGHKTLHLPRYHEKGGED
jgi:hypothetical protein